MIPAGVPKTDLHLHSETLPRLERLVSRAAGRAPHDWGRWKEQIAALPSGIERLNNINGDFFPDEELSRDDSDDQFVDWVTDALESSAQSGAVLVEVRFGSQHGIRPGFMSLFRKAESRVRQDYPDFCAEALITGIWPDKAGMSEIFDACLRLRGEGLAGIDFLPEPYDQPIDWTEAYRWSERAAALGLGVTAHAGEFSTANMRSAFGLPGLTRIGHGVQAASDPALMESLTDSGVALEICLTSNVLLGAASSLETHPVKAIFDAGATITLNTDNPVRMDTDIGNEYELAASLGFSARELLGFTRNAIEASFTTEERKQALRRVLQDASLTNPAVRIHD